MKHKSSFPFLKWTSAALLMLTCCMILGCDLTLGPKVKTDYVFILPGKPCRVMESAKVKVRLLNAEGIEPVRQDLGGWICMPEDHWELIKRKLESKKD